MCTEVENYEINGDMYSWNRTACTGYPILIQMRFFLGIRIVNFTVKQKAPSVEISSQYTELHPTYLHYAFDLRESNTGIFNAHDAILQISLAK